MMFLIYGYIELFEVSLNSSDSIELIELIWKTMMGSVERNFLLPILFVLYIVLILPVTVNKLLTKLRIVNTKSVVFL